MACGELRHAHVGVIGAGPCGLAVARELLKEGHSVVMFDAGDGVGGAWRFDGAAADSDLLGLDTNRVRVHSSMYPCLRTNQPRHVMSLCDWPFSTEALGARSVDPRTYPLHSEVLAFCEALADAADLRQHLHLNTRVVRIDPVLPQQQQQVQQSATAANGNAHSAVAVGAGSAAVEAAAAAGAALQGASATSSSLWQQPGLKWRVLTAAAAAANGSAQDGCQADGQQEQQEQREWLFDAVASCTGTFSEIRLPQVPGMSSWPGLQLHAHNFREAAAFRGQKVIVVGASFSGEEIARHIAREAREVLHCARTFTGPGSAREPPAATATVTCTATAADGPIATACVQAPLPPQHKDQQHQHKQQQQKQPLLQQQQHQQQQQPKCQSCSSCHQGPIPPAPEPRPNITRHPMLQQLMSDGSVVLVGGEVVEGVDAIVYCTGYSYSLPWMEHLKLVQTDNACVAPLFAHMFIPAVGPTLSLCGVPWRCLKFPQFQLQGQLLARVLSGRARLPPVEVMEQDQQQLFAAMRAQGIPLRYTHCQAGFMPQDEWAYAEQLVQLCAGTWQGNNYTAKQQPQLKPQPQPEVLQSPLQPPLRPPSQAQQEPGSQEQEKQQQQQQLEPSQRQLQQQPPGPRQHILGIPGWMKAVALATSGSILGRPDTFRDSWSEEADRLMAAADAAMHQLYLAGCCQ